MLNLRSTSTLAGMLALAAMAPSLANAQSCSLSVSAASYQIGGASHYDGTPSSNFTGVGTGDYLFEDGWWFRVSGDTREFFFPAPTTTTCLFAAGTITWADVAARGLFSARNTLALTSTAANRGQLILTMAITNLSALKPLAISLFHGADWDVNGSLVNSATLLNANNYIRIIATAGVAEYRAFNPPANAFLVSGPSTFFGRLRDAILDNFGNSGLPTTDMDFTGGFQWNLTIPASGTASVSVALNGNATPATPVELIDVSID